MAEELYSPVENQWVKETLRNIMDVTRESVLNWCGLLTKMGMDEENRNQWTAIFTEQVSGRYKDKIQEVTEHQSKMCVEIETLVQKSELLCKDLHIKMTDDYGSKSLSYYKMQQLLTERIQRYERLVEEKRIEIASLNKHQLELCRALGQVPKVISESPLPTPEFIQEFRVYLESLESEKFIRKEKFLELKTSIMQLVEELNFKPTLDFEKAIIFQDDSLFILTDNNMRELDNFYESLKQRLEDTKEERASLKERIILLRELLAEDLKNYHTFMQNHTGNSLNTLEAFRQEVKRCEDLTMANIEVLPVNRLRGELITLWDRCHFSDGERDWEYLHPDLYSEDVLPIYHLEIQKMQEYYLQNKTLFNFLEKREELWKKWQILEQQATDPNRYNNHGGQLEEKEEKERNALCKHITEIEEQLVQGAKDFKTRTGKEFLSWGETVENIIKAREKYDNEKKLKLSVCKQQPDKTISPGKSPCTSPQTLAAFGENITSAKRKPTTLLSPAKKRTCILAEKDDNVPKTAPPEITINGCPSGPPRYFVEPSRISQRLVRKRLEKENTADRSTENDIIFEREIQNKESCTPDASSSN